MGVIVNGEFYIISHLGKKEFTIMIIKQIKKVVGTFLIGDNSGFKRLAIKINFLIFHRKDRTQLKKFGTKNPDKTFYVVRNFDQVQGLLSRWHEVMAEIIGAEKDGYIPIVDFENYKWQYSMMESQYGTKNAWEYYFNQPTDIKLEEVYQSKNVILGGYDTKYITGINWPVLDDIRRLADLKPYIYQMAEDKMRHLQGKEVMGIFVRGTDLVSLKPAGHHIQPTVEQVMEKVEEFIDKYGKMPMLIATEDVTIYQMFVARWGDLCFTTDNNMISNYRENTLLVDNIQEKSKYEFGLDYLVKMLCLSKCDYLIASRASGSNFAVVMNNGGYKGKFVFDLGLYGKNI